MKWWIVVLVLGVGLTLSGTGIGRDDGSPGEITCGGETMSPGDVCEETQRGVVTDTYTYEEKVRDNEESAAAFARTGRWVQLGLGGALVLGAAVGIVLTGRRRARQRPATADLNLQHQVRQPWPQAPLPQQPQQPYPARHQPPYPPPSHPQYQQVPRPPHQGQPPYPDFGPRG